MSESLPVVYVAIGSNIEPEKNLQAAVDLLRARCDVLAVSSVYQSPPYGFADQPDFLDMAVKLTTTLSPEEFKTMLLEIERQLGRDRVSQVHKFGPRTVDLDILLWGDSAFSYGGKPWRVPDSDIVKYAAVAIPLEELAPDYVHPEEKVTLKEIAARFDDAAEIKRTDLEIFV